MPLLNDVVKLERGTRKPIGIEFTNDDGTPRDVSAGTQTLKAYADDGTTVMFTLTGVIGDQPSQVFFTPGPNDLDRQIGDYYADITMGEEKWHLTIIIEGRPTQPSTPQLVTLAATKRHLGIKAGETESDVELLDLIAAVSKWFYGQIGRRILKETYVEKFSLVSDSDVAFRDYAIHIPLANWPIVSVKSGDGVLLDGQSIPPRAAVDDPLVCYVVKDGAILILNWYPWLTTLSVENIQVTYDAGYDTVPDDVRKAVLEIINWSWSARDRAGQRSKSIAGEIVNFDPAAMPASAQAVVDTYRLLHV